MALYLPVITTIGDQYSEKFIYQYYKVKADWLGCNQCNAGDKGLTGLCQAPTKAIALISLTKSALERDVFLELSTAATSTWWQDLFTASYGDRTGADYELLSLVQDFLALPTGTPFASPMADAKLLGALFAGVGVKKINQEGMQLEMISKESIPTTDSSYNELSSVKVGCQASIYSAKALAKMIAAPPVKLVEANYKSCRASTGAAAQQTLGNALAMSGALAGSILTFALAVFTQLYNRYETDPKKKIKNKVDKAKEAELMKKINADRVPLAAKVIEALLFVEKLEDLRATPEAMEYLKFVEEQKKQLDALHNKPEPLPANPFAELCPCPGV